MDDLPTSLFALIIFICFVTPGFVFEMLRERRRPPVIQSAFREISVIVVASVSFSLLACFILFLLRPIRPQIYPDFQQLAQQPANYSADHLINVVWLVAAVVALAVGMAWIWDFILQRVHRRPRGTPFPVWYEVLTGKGRPDGAKAVALSVELINGARIQGAVMTHGLNKDLELDWLVLGWHSQWSLRSCGPYGDFEPLGKEWSYTVVSADEIRSVSVAYLSTEE